MAHTSALNRFQRIEKLGEGAYGVVYKAQDKDTHEFVALKRIPLDSADEVRCGRFKSFGVGLYNDMGVK